MFERAILYRAKQTPEHPAFWYRGSEVSYGRFVTNIEAVAATLAAENWLTGGVVLIDISNPPLAWLLMLALERLGHICVVGPAGVQSGVLPIVRPDVVITDKAGVSPQAAPYVLTIDAAWVSAALAPGGREAVARRPAAPDDVVAIILSSGTTGAKKQIPFTRAMIDQRVMSMSIETTHPLRIMAAMGMDTVGGFFYPLSAWTSGKTVILLATQGEAWIEAAPDAIYTSPATLREMMDMPGAFTGPGEIQVTVMGSATPPALVTALEQRGGARLHIIYGSTECGTVTTAPASGLKGLSGATGYAPPWVEIKAVDADGRPLAPGQAGEVWTKSLSMASHYRGAAQATTDNFKDGWFCSGDVGRIMPDGLLVIDGRADDVINIGGVKLSSNEVEHQALETAGVIQAGAATFQTHSGRWVLYLAVVSGGVCDLDQLSKNLSQKHGLPVRAVELPHIPRNAMGKIQRDQLRAEIVKLGA